jgi:DNA polymerase (family 10)
MPRSNDEVALAFEEFADLLAILSGDPYKPRAYEKAARSIGGYAQELRGLDDAGILAIPNVGRSIAEKVHAVLDTGTFPELEELRAQVPPGVREMTAISGFGPKKAIVVYRELGIQDLDGLVAAAKDGRLRGLKGFSAKTEQAVLEAIERASRDTGRVLLDVAMDVAESFLGRLRSVRGVDRAEYAGSLRRMAETIGDVDLLVASDDAGPVMDAFVGAEDVDRVLAHGATKSSIVTRAELQIDLRVVPLEAWGAAMIYFTGSKPHNVRIREMAVRKKLKLSEYGLFRVDDDALIAADAEEAVYERLGLPYIEPTLREDRGEIEAALAGTLPEVVTMRQIRGDLHTHTDLTDGVATLEQMLEAAATKRYAYYAVTDHAPNLFMQRMTDEKMLAQRDRLAGLQARFPKMTLLHGTELNIDPDGGVDWPAGFLAGFDVTIASIHSHFNQSRDDMTRRMIRAMEDPFVNVIGHPTTRKIGRRDPVDLDLEAVFEAAARTGTALEIDAYPDRLDLRDEHVLWARRHGVRFAIDTDSHAVGHLDAMRYGVGVAQRGWLTRDDVINAWPLSKLRRFLRKRRG